MILKRNRAKEEFWNVATHGLGALLSIVAAVFMFVFSWRNGSAIDLVASGVFGFTLILLYSASTVYHAMTRLRWKRLFQRIDHLCIYLLIAGTYTPVALLGLKGTWGWILFGMSWAFVVAGFVFKFSPLRRSEKLSLVLYGLMGWMAILVAKPLLETLAPGALWLILAGGLCYTFGIYFYAKQRKPYYHAIWHVFVLAGSACHFFSVFLYLVP
ncbi:PAQR family membrane homeostasis protein TrhA [Flavobacterium selenitireducens]|uniref:PAQR family membrane homeostasis protein TrhA n=1 Tax=Flavobacterium selenitireducens TaxID=2722704 RepID=UPI00168AE459|nr:hemolysin III family protein [Flavobacterium selenitireducens]MBD3582482.1 hemolysin III family protein [Flavobacterium selenitireducens]